MVEKGTVVIIVKRKPAPSATRKPGTTAASYRSPTLHIVLVSSSRSVMFSGPSGAEELINNSPTASSNNRRDEPETPTEGGAGGLKTSEAAPGEDECPSLPPRLRSHLCVSAGCGGIGHGPVTKPITFWCRSRILFSFLFFIFVFITFLYVSRWMFSSALVCALLSAGHMAGQFESPPPGLSPCGARRYVQGSVPSDVLRALPLVRSLLQDIGSRATGFTIVVAH